MHFRQMKIEDARGERRRMLESVMAQLEGKPMDIAGTVGVNVLIHFLLSECETLAEIDAAIDEIAQAMRDGCRAQIDRAIEARKLQ